MLKIGHSNENYWAVLSCGTVSVVYYAVQGGSNFMDEILECDHSKEQATEQYFSVALFIMLYKVFWVVSLRMKSFSVVVETKATKQYFSFKWSSYAKWIPI